MNIISFLIASFFEVQSFNETFFKNASIGNLYKENSPSIMKNIFFLTNKIKKKKMEYFTSQI